MSKELRNIERILQTLDAKTTVMISILLAQPSKFSAEQVIEIAEGTNDIDDALERELEKEKD